MNPEPLIQLDWLACEFLDLLASATSNLGLWLPTTESVFPHHCQRSEVPKLPQHAVFGLGHFSNPIVSPQTFTH